MTTRPLFRESLLAAKQRLTEGREKIKQQHESGSPGIQVCACLTDLLDTLVLELYESALEDLYPRGGEAQRSRVALVPHGGYGRRDVAPYSDVDLMILAAPDAGNEFAPLANRLMRDLYDIGLEVGQSVRTPAEACQLAMQDATICTSLIEGRYLAGSVKLYSSFMRRFQRLANRKFKHFFNAFERARAEESRQYGETIYLLEPNVKRTRGGLRDIQLLRWIGFARYGTAEPDGLQMVGAISKEDQRMLRRATEFLLRLRNEMHFHTGKSNDVLDRTEQLRLAELYKFEASPGLLPVELFMREYFRNTDAVCSVVSGFVARCRPGLFGSSFLGTLFSRQVEGDYRIGPRQIRATPLGLKKLQSDLSEVLRLTDLANLHDKRIAQPTWDAVREAVPKFPDEITIEACRSFLSLLSQPARLGELLHLLLELGVLEKIIPAFVHARCLLQFNEYHKYTVDEHCLLAVKRATEFQTDSGPLGRVYRGIKQKRTLHLALLIHDLGKGFVQDHSEIGLRIAGETAERLRLPLRETETLKFLVHKHLVMSHLAFRRDTSDDQLIVRFAVEVGSPEVLDMLFVLTAADFSAVGPGVWNDWKAEVLSDLHERTMQHLSGEAPSVDTVDRIERLRDVVRKAMADQGDTDWFHRQIEALPNSYWLSRTPERIAEDLKDLHTLSPDDVHASGRYLPESRAVEFVVGTHDQITPGVFHKLTGALASQGLQILSAEINTLADGLVLDRFCVHDPDYADEPPPDRLESVNRALSAALRSASGPPAFRKVWRSGSQSKSPALTTLPTSVKIDNSTSDRFTIVDVFARDRMGLLYTITRTLFEMGLSVSVAKIGTYLDQVVDVFYVTDQSGAKIHDEHRLHQIRAGLLEAIEGMEPQ